MMLEALGEPRASLQQRIIFTAPHRKIARRLVHGVSGILADIAQPLDQFAARVGKLPARLDPSPLQARVTHIRIEKQQAIHHRDQRKDEADGEQHPGIDVGQAQGRRQQPVQHFLTDRVVEADRGGISRRCDSVKLSATANAK